MGKLTRMPRAEQWADQICTQLGKSVESIIEVGRLLVRAKKNLPHGEWGRMFDEKLVPFGQRTGNYLMAVAEHPLISNSKYISNLPPSWIALYELTKVEPKRLSAAFKDGIISPDMKRRDVKALLPPSKKRESRRPQLVAVDPHPFAPEIQCMFDVEARIQQTFHDLDMDAQRDLLGRLHQLVEQLEQHVQRATA